MADGWITNAACQSFSGNYGITVMGIIPFMDRRKHFIGIGTCSPTPVLPTPVSPTLVHKVVFRLLFKKLYLGTKWCQTRSWSIDLSLKMYLGHVKVTSCAITGFVCTKSCSSWEYLPVQVNNVLVATVEVIQINTAEAGAHSPQRALKAIHRDWKIQELKECFDTKKSTLEKYIQGISAHTNV